MGNPSASSDPSSDVISGSNIRTSPDPCNPPLIGNVLEGNPNQASVSGKDSPNLPRLNLYGQETSFERFVQTYPNLNNPAETNGNSAFQPPIRPTPTSEPPNNLMNYYPMALLPLPTLMFPIYINVHDPAVCNQTTNASPMATPADAQPRPDAHSSQQTSNLHRPNSQPHINSSPSQLPGNSTGFNLEGVDGINGGKEASDKASSSNSCIASSQIVPTPHNNETGFNGEILQYNLPEPVIDIGVKNFGVPCHNFTDNIESNYDSWEVSQQTMTDCLNSVLIPADRQAEENNLGVSGNGDISRSIIPEILPESLTSGLAGQINSEETSTKEATSSAGKSMRSCGDDANNGNTPVIIGRVSEQLAKEIISSLVLVADNEQVLKRCEADVISDARQGKGKKRGSKQNLMEALDCIEKEFGEQLTVDPPPKKGRRKRIEVSDPTTFRMTLRSSNNAQSFETKKL